MDQKQIRNFSIIAHVDHGKSTLADRFIQICGGLTEREMANQVLDSMDLERERGITIKAQSVTLDYLSRNGETYKLNFIDTPGHVDFSYEVSRSLAACEGALLVVDAAQGVEAQSVANCYTAVELGLEVIPVLNKIDLPSAEPERVKQEIEDIIGIEARDALCISAKTGQGVADVLEALVHGIPCPQGNPDAPFKALIIDSWFDNYLGIVSLIRVVDGSIGKGEKIRLMSTGKQHQVEQVGVFTPKQVTRARIGAGEVGFFVAGIKDVHGAPVGDTRMARPRRCPVSRRCSRGCLPGCSLPMQTATRTCAKRSTACNSTMRRCSSSPRLQRPLALAFAAGSSACCTWISCRNASSANTTWTW